MNKLNLTVSRIFPYLLSIGGGIGFLAAFILTSEKIKIIKDPTYELSCNLNPLLSCGSVMTTPQAEVFGFPNSLIGIAGFAIITCIGMSLLAGAKFNRWFWVGMQLGVTFGIFGRLYFKLNNMVYFTNHSSKIPTDILGLNHKRNYEHGILVTL